ncbi:MAG: HAMP domain-containing histidine kinase [Lachnospiraceae bacterium]|nr:HAMP domain-containing histidine kinase [Lachnospiraceae bacterium]MBR1817175.1 HAMP domain-containing histidine kinase [Lachnospiraceae bacterium]
MIKTLQRKFIVTAMIAITILIVVLLGTVNVVNIVRLNNRNDNMMDMLSGTDRVPDMELPDNKPEEMQRPEYDFFDDDGDDDWEDRLDFDDWDDLEKKELWNNQDNREDRFRLFNPVINENDRMSAVYFIVRLDENKNIVFTDISRISSVDEDTAAEYAYKVLAKNNSKGKIDNYKYTISEALEGNGQTIVFLDVHSQTQSILAVVIASLGIGVLGWVLMLLLIIALSKKAIKPIAENIERQKQFITDAGHEIKTPLAIILANTDAMELHNGENKWSKNIRKQTGRLSELMQRMLSLAKMDEGTAKLKFEELDISRIVNELASSFKEPAKNKNISIEKEIADNVICKSDKESITQLVNILIDNAVKYADEGSIIKIKLKKTDKKMKLSVSNTCSNLPDIPPEKMFDRFYRGDSARTQKGGGFGIGLSVAQAVAEAHKGHISARYKDGNIIVFEVEI